MELAEDWIPFVFCAVWLLLHLLLYVVVLRERTVFRRESVVFAYHLASVLLLLPAGLVLLGWLGLAEALGMLSLHGIYSTSFLELWSLAQGSYSLSVLARIRTQGVLPYDIDLSDMEDLGSGKKEARLGALASLGLLEADSEPIRLTARGRALRAGFDALAWLARIEKAG